MERKRAWSKMVMDSSIPWNGQLENGKLSIYFILHLKPVTCKVHDNVGKTRVSYMGGLMQGEWILRFLFTPPVNQDQLRSAETTQAVSCVSQTKYLIARIKFIHWFILGKIHNFRPFWVMLIFQVSVGSASCSWLS